VATASGTAISELPRAPLERAEAIYAVPAGTARRWNVTFAALSVGAVCVYAGIGIWTIARGNFMIGDAAYRVSNARVMLFSRDPHAGAIGMVWMPMSTLATLPFTALLEPFGLGWAAGTVMSAAFGGATVWVLSRIGNHLGSGRWSTLGIIVLFAFNPVMIFWMGSAMMEAPSLFFLVWATFSWLRWVREPTSLRLVALGFTAGLGVLTRYEQVLVVAVFALAAAVSVPKQARARTVVMAAAPGIFALAVWCGVNLLIRGDALFFLHAATNFAYTAPISLRTQTGTIRPTLAGGIAFALQRVLRFAPILLLPTPLLLIGEVRTNLRRSPLIAPLLASLAVPMFVGLLTTQEKTSGVPRYFLSATVIAPLVCFMAVAFDDRRRRRVYGGLAAVALAVGAATSVDMELRELYTGQEHEDVAISKLTGARSHPVTSTSIGSWGDQVAAWRSAAQQIDAELHRGDLVALDSSTTFPVLLFTHRLTSFAISEDRDFEQLLSLSPTRFTYILVNGGTPARLTLDRQFSDMVHSTTGPDRWTLVASYDRVGQLWRRTAPSTGT
jgi:hypothetical protein